MSKSSGPLAQVQRAAERVRDAESRLADTRAELRAAMRVAHEAGYSYSAIGRVLGVTRQRVMRVLEETR